MRDLFRDVGDFHTKFDLPRWRGWGDPKPHLMSQAEADFRTGFLDEELTEFKEALAAQDLEKAADALVDLVWVALGTAHVMHIPFERVWAEVYRANMAKVRSTGSDDPRSTRSSHFDVVKPEGWQPPNHKQALDL